MDKCRRTKYDVIAVCIVTFLTVILTCVIGHTAEPATEANIIHALAGEAGGQGEAELIAHAHAIRNRTALYGDMRGIYGLRAKVSPQAYKRAERAYKASLLTPDTVNGADHWLSEYDLKHSRPSLIAWRHKAVYSVKVGQTTFYKMRA